MRYLVALLAAATLVSCDAKKPTASGTPSQGNQVPSTSGTDLHVSRGPELYKSYCATCHGANGQGDGPGAKFLYPKPRDFTRGAFKIRTTANGCMPTDEDLLATLERGLPGTAMPSFGHLSAADRGDLVKQIKSLAVIPDGKGGRVNLFESRGKPRVITVANEIACTPELVKKGRELYVAQNCIKCHGDTGAGDGPSSATLKDDWGFPIPPNNFTRGLFKGGSSARDIYVRFTTGLAGTPMPSFEQSLKDEERWALTHYVKSLVKPGRPDITKQKSDLMIAGKRVKTLPPTSYDSAWDGIAAVEVPLMHLWQRAEATDLISIRVAHDGDTVAVLLEWEDATCDGVSLQPQKFSDAGAVMFSLSDPPGHFTMGEKGKPCNIWHWRMDRQMDLETYKDVENQYPGMVVDMYPFSNGHSADHAISATKDQDPTYLTGRAAKNPASLPPVSAVQNLLAIGFGTLEAQPRDKQNVNGVGEWKSGKWRVLFTRKLSTENPKDIQLKPGGRFPIGFAVWDGSAGDRDGQKSVTYWQALQLEP